MIEKEITWGLVKNLMGHHKEKSAPKQKKYKGSHKENLLHVKTLLLEYHKQI